jgi:hypothetical protein
MVALIMTAYDCAADDCMSLHVSLPCLHVNHSWKSVRHKNEGPGDVVRTKANIIDWCSSRDCQTSRLSRIQTLKHPLHPDSHPKHYCCYCLSCLSSVQTPKHTIVTNPCHIQTLVAVAKNNPDSAVTSRHFATTRTYCK